MYYKVPINQRDYENEIETIQINDMECYVFANSKAPLPLGAIQITEEEWLSIQPPKLEPVEPSESTEQKLIRIEEQNLILMDALATTFEELIALRALVEGGTV